MASNADALSAASFEDIGTHVVHIPPRGGSSLGYPDPDEVGSTPASDADGSEGFNPGDEDDPVETDWVRTNDVHFVVRWEEVGREMDKVIKIRSLTPPDLPVPRTGRIHPPHGNYGRRGQDISDQNRRLSLFPSLRRAKPASSSNDEGEGPTASEDGHENDSVTSKEQDEELKPQGTPLLEFRATVTPGRSGFDMYSRAPARHEDPLRKPKKCHLRDAMVHERVLKINSEHIVNALRAVTDYPVDINLSKCPVEIPCRSLYLLHSYKDLQEFKVNQFGYHNHDHATEVKSHLDVLLDTLEYIYGDLIAEAEELEKKGVATLSTLCALLKPGAEAYFERIPGNDSTLSPCVIHRVSLDHTYRNDEIGLLSIHVWRVLWSENKFKRHMHTIEILPFAEATEIQKLSVVPARFHEEGESHEPGRSQTALGRLCWNLAAMDGRPYYELLPGYHIDGYSGAATCSFMSRRILIDYHSNKGEYSHRHSFGRNPPFLGPPPPPLRHGFNGPFEERLPSRLPGCRCDQCWEENVILPPSRWANLDDLDPRIALPPLLNQYYHALDKSIPCWLFALQACRIVHAKNIRPIFMTTQREQVVFGSQETRETIDALIGRFRKFAPASARSQVSMDMQSISKHGHGARMILLYGPTGTGKTAAVDHMAESSCRPLFRLEPILYRSDDCRGYLESTLDMCRQAGGIAFLDDAEKVLCGSNGSLGEASLSQSVILNCFDTYPGTILLATRNVARLDRSVTSRISTAIHFSALTDEQRNKIWTNKFHALEQSLGPNRVYISPQARVYVQESSEVAKLKWNGFEIQNALRNAIELAEDELPTSGLLPLIIPSHVSSNPVMPPRRPPPPRDNSIIVLKKHFRDVVSKAVAFKEQIATSLEKLHV